MSSIQTSIATKIKILSVIFISISIVLALIFGSSTMSAWQTIVLLGLLFASLLILFTRSILRPLQRIANEISEMRAGRAYTPVELDDRDDELGLIARFFNEVVQTIDTVKDNIHDRERLKKELAFAANVQKQLLPKKAPEIPGLDVVVRTRSATEIGGDNFDLISRGNDTLMYIGDATGHGFPAGLVMSMVNVLVQAAASMYNSTRDIIVQVNAALTPKTAATMFMTLAMLRWEHESQKLFYTGCGHEHILIYRAATQRCEVVKTGGIALGMVPDISKLVQETEIKLQPNDTVVLFTDGITEAKGPTREMYGVERLQTAVQENGGKKSAEHIFSALSKSFADFVGHNFVQDDDITLLVAKYNFKSVRSETGIKLEVDTSNIAGVGGANWEWEE